MRRRGGQILVTTSDDCIHVGLHLYHAFDGKGQDGVELTVWCSGLRVEGSLVGVSDDAHTQPWSPMRHLAQRSDVRVSGFRVWRIGFRVQALGFRGSGVQGLEVGV